MNRNEATLVDSDTSDHEAQPQKTPIVIGSSSASDNDTDTEYVYIDPVDDPAEELEEEEEAEAEEADGAVGAESQPLVGAESAGDNDSQLDDDAPITPLQQRTSDLVSRYLKRATQLATPDQLHSARRAARLTTPASVASASAAAAIDSTASSSDTGQATVGTGTTHTTGASNSQEFSSDAGATGHIARPMRRSVRLKSIAADSASAAAAQSRSTTPARIGASRRPSSVTTDELTIDEVCVSTTSASSAISSSQESASAALNGRLQQRLQVRMHRMSVDMAALSVSSGAEATGSATPTTQPGAGAVGRSPRTQRSRTPSAKCLESFNLEDLRLSTPRRTQRTRTPCRRYEGGGAGQRDGERTPRKRDAQPMETDEEEEEEELAEEEGESIASQPPKLPSMLYDQQLGDVAGAQMFSFRTPKKRNAMAALAAQAPKTPQTPKTPQRKEKTVSIAATSKLARTPRTKRNGTASKAATTTKTPSRVRSVLKRELAKFQMPDTSGSDFSADDSDEYKPQDDDDDEEEADSDEAEESGDEAADTPPKRQRYQPPVAPKTPSTARPATRRRGQQDFVPECEDYFTHHTNKKATTSDRTLERMRTPRLPHDDLFRLLAATAMSTGHEEAVYAMHREYRAAFGRWLFCLDEGFNIVVHGLGSKRQLLQQFHRDVLAEQTVLVVNGFFPSLTIKDVLDGIAVDVLGLQGLSRNLHEVVDAIGEELARDEEQHVFVIVHNIDGVMLRNHRAQLLLSRLARLRQVHLIASLDHINAPLLWDHIKLSNFNFAWWDCTTMLPYTEETAFENSMLVNNSGGLALSSMKNVFLSLTQNSRGIFVIIVRNQLQHKSNANFQGMPFKELYSRCREEFLVSSDVALRSQLTEFVDHQLVKQRRTADGIEHLMIPLDATLLQQFLELQENND